MIDKQNRKRVTSVTAKQRKTKDAEPQEMSATRECLHSSAARQEEIRRRAYEIYVERGKQPGGALDDWLRAERESNKALVLEAFDTLFNQRDYANAERYWSSDYIKHSAPTEPGRDGLFNFIKTSLPG